MLREADIGYMAGLFDGEGSITYKKYKEKKKTGTYDCWRIVMEISMTDKSVLVWFHEMLGCGTLRKKPRPGHKMQWRWRCSFRDAYYVARLFWPYSHTKLDKINKIIDHYAEDKVMNGRVVNLQQYKKLMSLE
tara:strand:- start:199 stop:597 length:399 start_codon:yes stop_codon:yes gene_type:complete